MAQARTCKIGSLMFAIMLGGCVSVERAPAADQAVAPAPAAQTSAEWYAGYLQNGRLVQLPGGRVLNIYCMGTGAPTVVLEAGLGGFAFDWRTVQSQIANRTRVCAYDRAGMGRSPAGPAPRDTRSHAADLEALLSAADIEGPYVLVGHSMGGYIVRLFASRRLDDVVGMVLVDPSVENQLPVFEAAIPEFAGQGAAAIAHGHSCADPRRTAEVAANCTRAAPQSFPADLAQAYVNAQDLAQWETFTLEVESFIAVDSGQVTAERRPLGDIPLIVLTRSQRSTNLTEEQAATELRLWNETHADTATLSTRGTHRVVPDAGHYIQIDQPDAVIGAVLELVDAARERRRWLSSKRQ